MATHQGEKRCSAYSLQRSPEQICSSKRTTEPFTIIHKIWQNLLQITTTNTHVAMESA